MRYFLSLLFIALLYTAPGPYAGAYAQEIQEDTVAVEAAQSVDTATDLTQTAENAGAQEAEHPRPPVWLVLPFALLLLMIATGPLFYPHHWHHHYPKYAVGLGLFTTLYYLFILKSPLSMLHAAQEYISFIALLASLFIAAGGIYIQVNRKGTAAGNFGLLFSGAVLSNIIGTTGASMLLIRPYMRLNEGRLKPYHIVFFIFVVSNVGGALTPIGDPPLFLGFLRGVPFFWTLEHVWYIWLPTVLFILAILYLFEKKYNKTESTYEGSTESGKFIDIIGKKNFGWLLVILLSVFIDPNVFEWVPAFHIGQVHLPFGIRELIMLSVCYLAYRFADREALRKNEFDFEPIREVAWLFVGIFATMVPALELIKDFAHDHAETMTVTLFYYGTGALSGVLDNAPTYLNFLAAAMGKFGLDISLPEHVRGFALGTFDVSTTVYLQAISVAAVFFGAMTYIGNGPNFMVKAIAESHGVEVPDFMRYIIKYSIPILVPCYVLVWIIFFSGWVIPIGH